MAKLEFEYRTKKVLILTARSSATSQFSHMGRMHQLKVKDVNLTDGRSETSMIQNLTQKTRACIDDVLKV